MTAAVRVLPWERQVGPNELIAPLLERYSARWPDADTSLIELAFGLADKAHSGQYRRSGEAYIHHPLAVATVVADIGLDDVSVAAALLHDAVEDTVLDLDTIETELGADVAAIVDGVTKLERLRFDSREAQQAATMRKMLVAMAKDLRVLIIKLADRLHNMRTIGVMSPEQQARTATETLEIYAPLAHRLGMQDFKQQLEDLAFAARHPRRFAEIDEMVWSRQPQREVYLEELVGQISERLAELGIEAKVTGRKKHHWSIYEKMIVKGKEFGEIFDLVGIRVIVDSIRDCYAALGSIHGTWRPVQGRFKDYVAMPKFNLYQSLHTTVVGPGGKIVEVQIRTEEMHRRAEHGVAAHWHYKVGEDVSVDVPWLNRIIDWESETSDPAEFMQNLKVDLEQDEVFVFTPKGDVVTLPVGATPIDFAYAIHTEVGHRCIGARINGRLVPLDTAMHSGDSVEVFTSKVEGAGPSRDWLGIAVTPRARNKIRQWFARERREDAIESGREELIPALRKEGLPVRQVMDEDDAALLAVVESFNYVDAEALFAAIGEGHVSPKAVAQKVSRELHGGNEAQLPKSFQDHRRPSSRQASAVHVEGLDDVMVRLARCCTPVPGDEIIGFVTRGRGVSVHRADCANGASLASVQADRLIDVEWDAEGTGQLPRLDRSQVARPIGAVE